MVLSRGEQIVGLRYCIFPDFYNLRFKICVRRRFPENLRLSGDFFFPFGPFLEFNLVKMEENGRFLTRSREIPGNANLNLAFNFQPDRLITATAAARAGSEYNINYQL